MLTKLVLPEIVNVRLTLSYAETISVFDGT